MTAQKQAPAVAFRAAVQTHDEIVQDETVTMTASTIDLKPLEVPVSGFLRRISYHIKCVTAGNSANVAFKEDGPWSAIDSVTFEDVNAMPVIGPLTGFDWYTICKLGGYTALADPKASVLYSATTGTGGTGGSFEFVLFLPVELVGRDALGALPNKSGSAQYKVRIRMAPSSAVYSTAPTTLGTVRVKGITESYWDPDATDARGNPVAQQPPALGTTQYWTAQSFDFTAGTMKKKSDRVGWLIRNLVWIGRASDGTRATMDGLWPDPFTLQVDATIGRVRTAALWRHQQASDFRLSGTNEAAGALNNAVFAESSFMHDFGLAPGAETRRAYLETTPATAVTFFGTTGGSGTQNVRLLTNDVAPAGGDYLSITAR